MIENFNELSKYAQDLFYYKNKKSKKYEIIKEIKEESLEKKVPIITDDVLNFMIFAAKNKNFRNWNCDWIFRDFLGTNCK